MRVTSAEIIPPTPNFRVRFYTGDSRYESRERRGAGGAVVRAGVMRKVSGLFAAGPGALGPPEQLPCSGQFHVETFRGKPITLHAY